MGRHARTLAAAGLLLALVGGLTVHADATKSQPELSHPKSVKERDTTDPNQRQLSMVCRNGRIHFAKAKVKRKEAVDERGCPISVIQEDAATTQEVASQLPPFDP